MEHIDVAWHHARNDMPVRLVSELDAQRYEVRKLEFFRSGEVGSATADCETGQTSLGTALVPALDAINTDEQFTGRAIAAAEFEQLWQEHGRELREFDVVQVIAPSIHHSEVHRGNVGTVVSVLTSSDGSVAYEVECVASNGITTWQGALERSLLRALPQ